MNNDKIDSDNNISIQSRLFTPKFFLLSAVFGILIFIVFYPNRYYSFLGDWNEFQLFYFYIGNYISFYLIIHHFVNFFFINLTIFTIIPLIKLKHQFFEIYSTSNKKNIKENNDFGIYFSIFISTIIWIGIFIYFFYFSDFINEKYYYFDMVGSYFGSLIGLTISSFILNFKLKNQGYDLLKVGYEGRKFLLEEKELPLFSFIEIDKDDQIKNFSYDRIFIFIFYNSILCFILFFMNLQFEEIYYHNSLLKFIERLFYNPDLTINYDYVNPIKFFLKSGFDNSNFLKIMSIISYFSVILPIIYFYLYLPIKKIKFSQLIEIKNDFCEIISKNN